MLLPLVAGLSRAAEPEMWLPGLGGKAADIDREVLWLDNPDLWGLVGTSEVIGEFGLETEFANDFILEEPATIMRVTWWGAYYNEYDGIPTGTGFNLRFYHHAGGYFPEDIPFLEILLPGDDCGETYVGGDDWHAVYVYEQCLELPLPPGRYWFSAQMADHEYPPQWGRLGADRIQGFDSVFRSEYFSYPDWWVPPFIPYDASQMFEDVCDEPTPIENASWGSVKGLYR